MTEGKGNGGKRIRKTGWGMDAGGIRTTTYYRYVEEVEGICI